MELYREFFQIIRKLNEHDAAYSVVGGIALAFYSLPRFTRDIDILGTPSDLKKYQEIFSELGYISLGKPWTFIFRGSQKGSWLFLYAFQAVSLCDLL